MSTRYLALLLSLRSTGWCGRSMHRGKIKVSRPPRHQRRQRPLLIWPDIGCHS